VQRLRPYANALLGMLLGVVVLLKLIRFIDTIPFLVGLALILILTVINTAVSVRSQHSLRYGGNMVVVVILFLTVVVVAQLIFTSRNWAIDLTENKRFTLAEQTEKVLQNLDQDVEVLAFFVEGESGFVEDLLQRYRDTSGRFRYRIIDADQKPADAKPYNARNGQIVLLAGDKKEVVTRVTEEAITNALIRVTREERKVVYFTGGHGELNPEESDPANGLSLVKRALEDKNYRVAVLQLVDVEEVPEDCNLLVIAGPETDLLEGEIERVRRYVSRGGKLMVLLDPPEPQPGAIDRPLTNLKGLLAEYNLVADNTIIIDQDIRNQLFGGDLTVTLVTQYEDHPITRSLRGALSVFPLSRSVSVGTEGEGTARLLAKAGEQAWGETNLSMIFQEKKASPDPDQDVIGSPGVMGLSEVPAILAPAPAEEQSAEEEKTTQVVLFGDSDFASDAYVTQAGNWSLLLNTVNWLTGEADLVAIPPRPSSGSPVILSRKQAGLVSWLPILVLPLLVMVAGSVVIISRKQLKPTTGPVTRGESR
jgi:ABC-type uncharacterized transport system involved in gliding motility auxiliary subunit